MFWLPWKTFRPPQVMLQINFEQNLEIFHFESVDNIRRQRTTDPCYTIHLLYISSHFGSSETKSDENDEPLKIVQE